MQRCAARIRLRRHPRAGISRPQSAWKLIAESPRNLRALNLRHRAWRSAGDLEKANQRLRQALEVDPGFQPASQNLSISEFRLGHM